MRITYIGPNYGTSLHRARAFKRLGHEVTIVDVRKMFGQSLSASRWLTHTSGLGLQSVFARYLLSEIQGISQDLIWVNQEPFLGNTVIQKLRRFGVPIVNFALDDPFAARVAWRQFRSYRNALPEYDLVVVGREVNVEEVRQAGAHRVMCVFRSADEVAHHPRDLSETDRAHFASDVLFIGTWMPERGPFMARLLKLGVPLTIWGPHWDKANEWPILRQYWRGPGLFDSDDYAKAIQCAKISLGLLSKGNRDLHTQRSFEIPALGGLFCAERTSEHLALYLEDKEAVFWGDADECAEKCKWLLGNTVGREIIARAGNDRCLQNEYYNERVLDSILAEVEKIPASTHNARWNT